ncbi:cellulose biosynthesis cyclic di-GMP-binding regulatory protein BcsB [Fusibacter ferrireducens]|uniref:Cellulose biosynthesis cyclic di-GMP-binding regulatory protein BcsB n=1 Tax=Fusibacter ferrireducens TaxID=2785058 RepID=A0ABR9ZQI9_9FIRM|nr:cellulose biosynthesis cyclic di-GMP-binding regulatory protein BcsB [Fusibacter ferrireducens]MBF4692727.1 cellulose biosynthesis cyclic di-GMP-binding regulatory protein BcsB [Fusibacter ferrireducens]
MNPTRLIRRIKTIGVILLVSLLLSNQILVFAQESDKYAIQMGRFNERINAERLLEKLTKAGHESVIVKTGNYVVYYGIYDDYSTAYKALPTARKYIKDAYIVKIKNAEASASSISSDVPVSTTKAVDPTRTNDDAMTLKDETQTANDEVTTSSDKAINANDEAVTSNDEAVVSNDDATNEMAFNQLVGNDLLLQGVYGQGSIFFTVNEYWQVKDVAYFDLYFQHSYTGVNHGSSITVELNGSPIESFFVDQLDGGEHFRRIKLPKTAINQGFNEIRIKSYHRITDLICEDDANPANWITIFGKSYLHLEYDDQQTKLDLSTYPFPYLKSYVDQPVQYDFLVEAQPSLDVIQTIMTIASDAGKRVKFKNIHFNITVLEDMKPDANYIYVGTSMPSKLKPYFNQVSDEKKYIAQSSYNKPYSILAIISDDPKQLPNIARGLANDIWKSQLSDNFVTFDAQDLTYEVAPDEKNIFEFSELGYGSLTLEGAKSSSAQYFVDIPDNWTLEKEASLVLKLRYSKVIDYQNSSVSVVINNIPVGSEILHEEGADSDVITFNIPDDLKESKAFAISVNLYLDGDFDCRDGSINTNYWAYISNESTLYLPHVPKIKYNLSHYPAPFVSDFHMDDANFVLDANYTNADIEMLMDVVGYLSHEISRVSEFTLTLDQGIPEKNNIFITSLTSNLFKSINEKLNVSYDFETKQFESKNNRRLLDPFNKNLSTAQLISNQGSPFMDLMIAYQGERAYKWISPYLTDLEFVGKLDGNTIFVDQNGYYQIFDTTQKSTSSKLTLIDQNPTTQIKRVSYENSRNFLIFLGVMLLVIIVIIVVIATRFKKSIR